MFLLPVWPTAGWWRFVGGGMVAAYYPAGPSLLSAGLVQCLTSTSAPYDSDQWGGQWARTNCAVVPVSFAPALGGLQGLPWYSESPARCRCPGFSILAREYALWSACARPSPVHPDLLVCVECALRGVGLPSIGPSQHAEWVRLIRGTDPLAAARHRASTRAWSI